MHNRLLAFARLAFVVAERVLPLYAHNFAQKRYTQPQLLACLLVKEYLNLDYRSAEEVLDASTGLRDALGLKRAPNHSTLWHFARHRLTPELIEQALAETVRLLDLDAGLVEKNGSDLRRVPSGSHHSTCHMR